MFHVNHYCRIGRKPYKVLDCGPSCDGKAGQVSGRKVEALLVCRLVGYEDVNDAGGWCIPSASARRAVAQRHPRRSRLSPKARRFCRRRPPSAGSPHRNSGDRSRSNAPYGRSSRRRSGSCPSRQTDQERGHRASLLASAIIAAGLIVGCMASSTSRPERKC